MFISIEKLSIVGLSTKHSDQLCVGSLFSDTHSIAVEIPRWMKMENKWHILHDSQNTTGNRVFGSLWFISSIESLLSYVPTDDKWEILSLEMNLWI